jgi:glycosyltransferase involved in cell wall biosynthesis
LRALIVTPFKNFAGGVESYNKIIQSVLEEDGYKVDYLTAEGAITPGLEVKSRMYGKPAITAARFKDLDSEKYDVVICNGEFSLGINHPHVINIFHGSFKGIRDFTKKQISFQKYLSLSWQSHLQVKDVKGKKVVTVSEFNAKQLEEQGVHVDEILLNPIYTKRFKYDGQKREGVLNVSTYKEFVKGFDLIEKLSQIRDDITCCTDVEPKFPCRWVSSVGNVDVVELYNSHKVTIIPSRFESASLVALESMSCGTPIIMNRVGYALEIEKEIPEFVLGPECLDDPNAYNDRIKLIENDYERLSKLATDYVKRYHCINVFKDNFLRIIRN